jgi:hypothetical protein
MYCLTVEYIRPRGTPSERSISLPSHPPQLSMFPILESSLVIHHIKHSRQDVGCYASLSGPNLYIIVHSFSCAQHEPSSYSRQHRPTPKNTLRGNPGCAVRPKTPTLAIPRKVIEHSLNIEPTARLVTRRLRRFNEEKRKAIWEEVAKLLVAGCVNQIHHSVWVANSVLVKQKNEN